MGWNNPPIPWSDFEQNLSGTRPGAPRGADGGDSPAWSRKRQPYTAPADVPAPEGPVVPYAELHVHSNFSFLDGASSPEHLARKLYAWGRPSLARRIARTEVVA